LPGPLPIQGRSPGAHDTPCAHACSERPEHSPAALRLGDLAGRRYEYAISPAARGAPAVVGSSSGLLISALHSSPVTIVPVIGDTHRGLGIQGSF
jgi:hypothetical protein